MVPSCAELHGLVTERASATPLAPAVLAPERLPLTYAGVLAQVERAAAVLQACGIGPEDRVAVVLPNGPEMAVCFLAIAAVAACAPLNPAYRTAEFEFYLSDLQAKAVIMLAGAELPARDVAAARGIRVLELHPSPDAGAGSFVLAGEQTSLDRDRLAGRENTALVLHTSGTTARPKMVALNHANLCTSAVNIANWLALTPDDRCLNVMPLFHIHGLVGATLATFAGGGSLVCTPGFLAPRFFEWLETFEPTWYTAVPTMHQAVLARAGETPASRRFSLRFIRSSSAALPPQVMTGLEELFGVPVLEAYGMTEASHQMACNPLPPRPRKAGSVGLPAGPRMAVMDGAGHLLDPGQVGEIVLQGDSVTKGYVANDDANAASFTAGWFRTGDQGSFDEDGYLFIRGRTKEIINRGGEKVSPREVEEILLDHPAVAEALAFAMPDPRLGEEVAAAVVLRAGQMADERGLRAFAAERLVDFKLPRRFVFLEEMPKGATGKPQRIGLAERLGLPGTDAVAASTEFVEPRTTTELLLARLWARVLRLERVGITQDFFAAGGDSLSAIEMVTDVEAAAGVRLSVADLFEAPTIETLAALIDRGPGERRPQRLFAIQPNGTRRPFFCIGAGPLMRDLALRIGTDQPFLSPLCYDFSRLPHPCRIEDIAAFHVETIRAAQPDGPYLVGGWCIDGLVAWEVARQLRAQDHEVALLVLFDTVNEAASPSPLHRFTKWLGAQTGEFRAMGQAQRMAYLKQKLRGLAGKFRQRATQLDYDMRIRMRLRLDSVLADVLAIQHRAGRQYRPGPLDAAVLLLRRSQHSLGDSSNDALGWRALAHGGLEVHDIPADHREMFLEPQVATTARVLGAALENAGARSQPSS